MSTHQSHAHNDVPSTGNVKTLPAYITGLLLCLVLTFAAFGVVAAHLYNPTLIGNLSTAAVYITVAVLAIVQLIVQVICFLRLNASPEGRWELMPFLFTLLIVAILVSGSLWIMYNLNINMMH